MSTVIVFIGGAGEGPLAVAVDADPGHVQDEFVKASGLPFTLDRLKGDGKVYVNPDNIAYWHERTRTGKAEFAG